MDLGATYSFQSFQEGWNYTRLDSPIGYKSLVNNEDFWMEVIMLGNKTFITYSVS
jgi:hypothetical protein